MIVEPIQGNGGMIMPTRTYFRDVKALLERYGVLLIADEIQTGFGRTGKMFAMEHFDVVPDIISMAKALGNGIPVAAFATTDEIALALNRPSASTFGGIRYLLQQPWLCLIIFEMNGFLNARYSSENN